MRASLVAALLSLSLVSLSGAAPSVRADYITGELTDVNGNGLFGGILSPGAGVTINLGDGSSPSVAYYPGVVNWTVKTPPAGKPNASWAPAVGSNFTTFCIELPQEIYPGNVYTYQLTALANAPNPGTPPAQATPGTPGMGAIKAGAIEELWGQDHSSIGTNGTDGAAFQLAVWKLEYDWGTSAFDSFSAGNFRATGNTTALAQARSWLDAVKNNPNSATPANLIALTDPYIQDQVTELPGGAQPHLAAPAPPGVTLAAIGAFFLLLFVRRHRTPALVRG